MLSTSERCNRKRGSELGVRVAKFKRGPAIPTRGIQDKKLKGTLRHTEALAAEAAVKAAKASHWLLPSSAGALEAEGADMVQADFACVWAFRGLRWLQVLRRPGSFSRRT